MLCCAALCRAVRAVRWRELYLPAGMVLDGVALMAMRCWALMSEIQPGETAKILFMVGASEFLEFCGHWTGIQGSYICDAVGQGW